MKKLVRSALKRQIEFEGRLYLVRPPTIQDAAEIIVTATGYIANEATNTAGFVDVVHRWLPKILASGLLANAVPRVHTVNVLLKWLMEGVDLSLYEKPKDGDKKVQEESTLDRVLALDLDDMLAEYAYAYKADPWLAYQTVPWTMFLQFHRLADRMEARMLMRQFMTDNIPNISNEAERKDAIEKLKKQAGYEEPTLTREERIERGKRNLEWMVKILGQKQGAKDG